MKLITCENLTLGYEGKAILSGLNFTVNSGDYLCIVGENGSGKSTLMKTLLHLQSPMAGTITMGDGLKINEIGYLPQQTALQRDFARFIPRPRRRKPENSWKKQELPIWLLVVTESFPVDSSRECFLPEPYVLREKSFFWMSRFPAWIRWQLRICIRLSVN